jgi:hypothetical protein
MSGSGPWPNIVGRSANIDVNQSIKNVGRGPIDAEQAGGMNEKPRNADFAWFPAYRWIRAHTRQSVRLDLIAGLSLAAFVIRRWRSFHRSPDRRRQCRS